MTICISRYGVLDRLAMFEKLPELVIFFLFRKRHFYINIHKYVCSYGMFILTMNYKGYLLKQCCDL